MKDKTNLLLLGILIMLAFNLSSQNIWGFGSTTKTKNCLSGDCTLLSYSDIEDRVEWQYALGEGDYNEALDIAFAPDSNFIILYQNGGFNLAKYNYSGEKLWNKELLVTPDTPFIARQFIRIGTDYYISGFWGGLLQENYGIMKVNSTGDKLWLKTIAKTPTGKKRSFYRNPSIIKVEDNNLLVSVKVEIEFNNHELQVFKYDSALNEIWVLNDTDLDYVGKSYFKILNINNNYLLNTSDFYALIEPEGQLKSSGTFLDTHVNFYFNNSKLFACGYNSTIRQWIREYSTNMEVKNEYLGQADESFNNIYNSVSINYSKYNEVISLFDYDYGWDLPVYNINLLHLNAKLNCNYILDLPAQGSQQANKLLVTDNNEYIIFGHGYNAFYKQERLLLMKINSLPVSVKPNLIRSEFTIKPNPVSNLADIIFPQAINGWLHLYNIAGQLKYQCKVINSDEINLDLSGYKNGTYLIQIQTKGKTFTNKIIKL